MNCNIDLHESLIESGDIVCPFIDFQLTYVNQKPLRYDCCDCQDIINNSGMTIGFKVTPPTTDQRWLDLLMSFQVTASNVSVSYILTHH